MADADSAASQDSRAPRALGRRAGARESVKEDGRGEMPLRLLGNPGEVARHKAQARSAEENTLEGRTLREPPCPGPPGPTAPRPGSKALKRTRAGMGNRQGNLRRAWRGETGADPDGQEL